MPKMAPSMGATSATAASLAARDLERSGGAGDEERVCGYFNVHHTTGSHADSVHDWHACGGCAFGRDGRIVSPGQVRSHEASHAERVRVQLRVRRYLHRGRADENRLRDRVERSVDAHR